MLTISVDIRHPEDAVLTAMHQDLIDIVESECQHSNINGELVDLWCSPPISFAPKCIQAVRSAVERLDVTAMDLVSGAGHDAVYISKVAPTSMIFIPCEDGLSHNELEKAEKEDVIIGANVLLYAVLEMACRLKEPSQG